MQLRNARVWRLVLPVTFRCYLQRHLRLSAAINLETDRPIGEDASWRAYDRWPAEWKQRLTSFYLGYAMDMAPPLPNPAAVGDENLWIDSSRGGLFSTFS